jgi:hypothetical protein
MVGQPIPYGWLTHCLWGQYIYNVVGQPIAYGQISHPAEQTLDDYMWALFSLLIHQLNVHWLPTIGIVYICCQY